ncbi:SDR family oxidoreductase [Enterovirga rhinocerotis]|uniref:Putative oxidoreductase n=1 Tax=Enterovirga rhinocerotis TaxID=1339210 RepID=A0A4R7C8G7_9HYPH|nr:SDR family oxidoreductase [Enterovirga rhinocerotis]TDR94262.1 putative oxidoreductase [Enterovirga rhinocerotis]
MKPSGNTILMTGGGSGIGAALAQRFHDEGNAVIVAGRRKDALDHACEGRASMHAMTLDIESAVAIDAFAQEIVAKFPALNIVVNNAGIMRSERLESRRDLADAETTIATNLLGPIRMTNSLVDHLVAQPDAAIVNVSSGLAFVPMFTTPTYNATKAAIHSYTLSLREALKGKVEVIELAPPGVQTGLTPGQETRAGYQPLGEFIDEVMALFNQQPTPQEIVVPRARLLRSAEAEGRFDAAFEALSDLARKARGD